MSTELSSLLERVLSVHLSPDDLAQRASDQIVSVGTQSHPVIRDQAHAFKNQVTQVIHAHILQAVRAEQIRFAQALREIGHADLIPLVEERIKW